VTDVRITTVATVKAERVRWLWPGRIPRGKLTLLDGDPDKGKSTITLNLAARVTTASPMPDGAMTLEEPAAVLILSAEDGVADTIRPRLTSAGADLSRVHVLEAVWCLDDEGKPAERDVALPGDVNVVERAVEELGVILVVIDPLAAYLSERVDSYKDHHVRRALRPLAAMAERTGAAVVIIRHFNKSPGANALYRGGGSIGIIGAARSALLVAADPDDGNRRILAVSKCNLAAKAPSLAYRLVPDELHDCAAIVWEGPTNHRADDLLDVPPKVNLEQSSAIEAAESFLKEVLYPEGQWVKSVMDDCKLAGLSKTTLRRAAVRLGVIHRKVGSPTAKEHGWKWELPSKVITELKADQEPNRESAGQVKGAKAAHIPNTFDTFEEEGSLGGDRGTDG
jgi:hypothetical protein